MSKINGLQALFLTLSKNTIFRSFMEKRAVLCDNIGLRGVAKSLRMNHFFAFGLGGAHLFFVINFFAFIDEGHKRL